MQCIFNATFYRDWMRLDKNDVVIGVAPFFHITGLIAHLAVAGLVVCPLLCFIALTRRKCCA